MTISTPKVPWAIRRHGAEAQPFPVACMTLSLLFLFSWERDMHFSLSPHLSRYCDSRILGVEGVCYNALASSGLALHSDFQASLTC